MNFFINQQILIHSLKVGNLTNSSVLQIGSAGMIQPVSHLYNTGGFAGPAPSPNAQTSTIQPRSIAPLPPPQI